MWTRLDDALIDHRKIFVAGDIIGKNGAAIAIGLYAIGLMWTNKQLSDGFLPLAVVRRFPHVVQPLKIAAALVSAELWEQADGGFQIHDYLVYNVAADAVRAEREWDRRRKQLYSDPGLIDGVRDRDANRCRYCGQQVDWRDRRSNHGGQFDLVKPGAGQTLTNVVVACRGCATHKQGRTPEEASMTVLPPQSKG